MKKTYLVGTLDILEKQRTTEDTKATIKGSTTKNKKKRDDKGKREQKLRGLNGTWNRKFMVHSSWFVV